MTAPSRYPRTTTLSTTTADGRTVSYLPRRFLPQPETMPVASTFTVRPGQRDDLIATVTLNDPELSWLLADANAARRPSELAHPGQVIAVPGTPALGGDHGF